MVSSFQRQKSVLQNQMKDLKVNYDKLETELQSLIEKENISTENNVDILRYKSEISDIQVCNKI